MIRYWYLSSLLSLVTPDEFAKEQALNFTYLSFSHLPESNTDAIMYPECKMPIQYLSTYRIDSESWYWIPNRQICTLQ
jgi:hypothetical protein